MKKTIWALSEIKSFSAPKIDLEQYMTPAELAAAVVHVMEVENNDVSGKKILDLGCGTGMMSAACLIYGAEEVLGIDIDGSLSSIYIENISRVCKDRKGKYVFKKCDITSEKIKLLPQFDVAVINPPFGTKKNKGIDILFLEKALEKAPTVYSMHKTSTRAYLEKKYIGRISVLSEMRFEIPRTYSFHRKKSLHVMVDLLRVTR